MKIYIAIWRDRHSDVGVYPFSQKISAIKWAKDKVKEMDRFGDLNETLTVPMKTCGWLYYGCYSCEGDCIIVVEKQIDSEIK